MKDKKVFILLPDGNGLRNFIFGNFGKIIKNNSNVFIWNNSPINLKELGFNEILIPNAKNGKFSDLLKTAKRNIELNLNNKIYKTNKYSLYTLKYNPKGANSFFKKALYTALNFLFTSKFGLNFVNKLLDCSEIYSEYYKKNYSILKQEMPDIVFCTNQRPLTCIAPILAAKKLNIKTATFIFSWDNIPKATMVIAPDYYFVWSEYMKVELLKHYDYISDKQVIVTGSPQFENHFNESLYMTKDDFYTKYNLNPNYKYICFSGNDITTSPYDQNYLEDLAIVIRELNINQNKIKIIFRRCPVDFSDRFKNVLNHYSDVIVNIETLTENFGTGWNAYVPNIEDIKLQTNIIRFSEFVVNVGSTMVFDFICHDKSCMYINYNSYKNDVLKWNIDKIYSYQHFESMPNKEVVLWINNTNEYADKILELLNSPETIINNAQNWFKIVNGSNSQNAPKNIWDTINNLE